MSSIINNNHFHNDKCSHMNKPTPPNDKFPTGGWINENLFAFLNEKPCIVDSTLTKFGPYVSVSENVITKVSQRREDSCVNLAAVLDFTQSITTNKILNSYLCQIISNNYQEINNILPIIKSAVKFKLNYTVLDDLGGIVQQATTISTCKESMLHTTDIRDYFLISYKNIFTDNISQMDYAGLYTLVINNVELYLDFIDVSEHITNNLNPFYQFTNSNTNIAIQHDTIDTFEPDESLLFATCDINRSFTFQANITTRIKMSFMAYISNIIFTPDTFEVWKSLYQPNDSILDTLQAEIDTLNEKLSVLENNSLVLNYKSNTLYKKGDLIWLNVGTVYQATVEFKSSVTGTTLDDNFQLDIDKGYIIPINSSAITVSNTHKLAINFKTTFGTDTPNKLNADMYLATLTPPISPSVDVSFINIDTAADTYLNIYSYFINPTTDELVFYNSSAVWHES